MEERCEKEKENTNASKKEERKKSYWKTSKKIPSKEEIKILVAEALAIIC